MSTTTPSRRAILAAAATLPPPEESDPDDPPATLEWMAAQTFEAFDLDVSAATAEVWKADTEGDRVVLIVAAKLLRHDNRALAAKVANDPQAMLRTADLLDGTAERAEKLARYVRMAHGRLLMALARYAVDVEGAA